MYSLYQAVPQITAKDKHVQGSHNLICEVTFVTIFQKIYKNYSTLIFIISESLIKIDLYKGFVKHKQVKFAIGKNYVLVTS